MGRRNSLIPRRGVYWKRASEVKRVVRITNFDLAYFKIVNRRG